MMYKKESNKIQPLEKPKPKWHFIGLEYKNEKDEKIQKTKSELDAFTHDEKSYILKSIVKLKLYDIDDVKKHKCYDDYNQIYSRLGRIRFDNFRLYTLNICSNYFLILYVAKKNRQDLTPDTKKKIVNRAKFYESTLKKNYDEKYCKGEKSQNQA